jgi:hypothetical protein
MEKRKWLMGGACILALVLDGGARGQINPIIGYGFTAPVLALPGQTISVCAFDWILGPVPAGPVTITEQVVDVVIGAAVAQQSITLPISPFAPSLPKPPTPCLQFQVSSAATSPAGPGELVVGAVILYPPPTTGTSSGTVPASVLSASMNVTGNSSVQTIPIPIQTVVSNSLFRAKASDAGTLQ